MNLEIPLQAKVSDILKTVENAEEGSHIYCSSERHFSLLKICLVKLQKSDLSIYLLDQHGFTVKQVSAHRKSAATPEAVASQESVSVEGSAAPVQNESEPAPENPDATAPVQPEPVAVSPQASPEAEAAAPAEAVVEQGLNHQQISAVRDLEQALRKCKELQLLLVGFSDGLVAVPEALGYGTAAISSAEALEVEAFDVYRGYEADDEPSY
ncbi:hypothetical protein DV711_03625 [Motiliproteus coralliicola]|uniref:Uncharacterized protein n=1 Tax=Motiliproteus coralliicola TaxID=2283196 RepID=A0A369WSN0_9GAMM|nr:hypothetical protein [Motiliproteus coralliicola]RDE24692.1 hypothetical protein DV711_03625 [Motiliproteus coralliicola]